MPSAAVSPLPATPPECFTKTAKSSSISDHESLSDNSQSLQDDENSKSLTPYQKAVNRLRTDEKWHKEITLERRIGFYRIHGELGSGNFSQVKAAVHCLTKEKVAIKILNKTKMDQKTQKMLSREILSMESLHHPHIIRLYEVMETINKIYLVMEHAEGGELFHRISNDGPFTEEEVKPLFAQITSAVDHMHSHNIIHRDIKAENVFFTTPHIIKVGDFGFSTQISESKEALKTFCGSPPYAAPELFRDDSYVGSPVDIWALGVLLYFMLSGSMPFKAQTVSSLKKLIMEGRFSIPIYISPDCQWLIKGILKQDPQSRLTVEQIKRSKWLQGQVLPSSLPNFNLVTGTDSVLTKEEMEAKQQLEELGVTDEMVIESRDGGARSNVIGIYRIILHKLQKKMHPDNFPPKTSLEVNTSFTRLLESGIRKMRKSSKSQKSRACIIL